MSTEATTSDREAVLREKRGQGLVARDLVRREGDHFIVTVPSLRGKRPETYMVSRDEQGRAVCSCPLFVLESKSDLKFRCEHIHAVKHAQAKKGVGLTEISVAKEDGEESTSGQVAEHDGRAGKDSDSVPQDKRASEIEAQLNNAAVDRRSPAVTTKPATARIIPMEFAGLLRSLRQPVDPKLVKTREGWTDRRGDTRMVEYVEWHTVADILDRACPTWSHAVRSVAQIGSVVAVTAAITIDGVTREGVGTGAAASETGIKKAEHDALKRAAVKFGIARDLYQRETELAEGGAGKTGYSNPASAGSRRGGDKVEGFAGFPRDPVARGTNDLVTPKQLGMIRALARQAGVEAEGECLEHMRCKPEDLSKRAASSLIDYLKEYPQSANKTQRRAG
jgi:hypothetical protein